MASLIVLKGSRGETLDLTRFIPMSKYSINNIINYDEWTDSNYTVHRRKTDEKAGGDFTLRFPSVALYQNFVAFISTHRNSSDGSIKASVWLDNEFRTKDINAFIDFEPQNDLPLLADNKSDGFTVELTERG